MAEPNDDSQAAREERARRLREQIENLKAGKPDPPGEKKSIREQIEDAERKLDTDNQP